MVDVANEAVLDEAAPAFAVATVTGNTLAMHYTDMSALDAVNVPAPARSA